MTTPIIRHGKHQVGTEAILVLIEAVMHVPKQTAYAGKLGSFRSTFRIWMDFDQREVPEDDLSVGSKYRCTRWAVGRASSRSGHS